MAEPKNLIFWGAGATAALGMRMTKQQAQFILQLTDAKDTNLPLAQRVATAFNREANDPNLAALEQLITILGDSDDSFDRIDDIKAEHLNAMSQNWDAAVGEDELRKRIMYLRLVYDWPALKSVIRVCPAIDSSEFKINDLFNLLDMHIPVGFGFPAPAGIKEG